MKKFLNIRLSFVVILGFFVLLVLPQGVNGADFTIGDSYTIQAGDNAQLSGLYDRIDAHMEAGNTERLVSIYDQLYMLNLQYGKSIRNQYFLTKIEDYLTERLFRANTASNFSCLTGRVQKGDTVTVEYALQTVDGKKISLSSGNYTDTHSSEAILFNVGKGSFTQGVDMAVYGMRTGSTQGVTLKYQNMYGAHYDNLVVNLPHGLVENALMSPLQVGSSVILPVMIDDEVVQAKGKIISFDVENVIVDFNAPLAGENIVGLLHLVRMFKGCESA